MNADLTDVCLDGSLSLDLPPAAALPLFTPEGERDWVPGWDPHYPAGRPDRPDPGTVFVTGSPDVPTTWIVLERSEATMRYARVATGRTAGTVTVSCSAAPSSGTTSVQVRYELTALGPEGRQDLAELAGDYPAFLDGWRRAIEEAGLAHRSA